MGLFASPISEALGATVSGASAAGVSTKEVAGQIGDALDRYGVLVIPRLNIGDDDLVALSRRLGNVVIPPHGAIKGYPEIMPVARDPAVDRLAEYRKSNDVWHMDGTSYDAPDKATLLVARRAPDEGEGDTEFVSTYAAYPALPDHEKRQIAGLRVRHTFASAQRKTYPHPTEKQEAEWARVPERVHPLVWRRLDGRSSLVIGSTAEAIEGLPDDEGQSLIDHLTDWATQPRFTIRHTWSEGDLVIFDNTGLLHRSCPYADTSPRLMHRTTLAGEEAFASPGATSP